MTAATRHTPGPWEIHDNIGRKGQLGVIADRAPCIIAIMGNAKVWPVEARANAEFIVRACNEYERLVSILQSVVNDYEAAGCDGCGTISQLTRDKAIAAIAKAGGKAL